MNRASLMTRFALLTGACVALPTLFACLDHPLKPVEYEAAQEGQDSIALTVNKDVDILFVIDNSGSMGEEQGTLAQNFEAFISVLEAEGVEANYRIGVTTTDNGNPWCTGTTPEGGALRLTSCRSRQSEFVFMGATTIDATQEACLDVCVHDTIDVQPTTTHLDDQSRPRPWLENLEGATNLPDGVTTVEAFQCFGPQGINGCGFEQHLESMYKALKRQETASEDSYGFIRPNAILSVVFVTDEVDCSHNQDHQAIFLPEAQGGTTIYWSLPDEGSPTSAVCWNAGVECTGGGSPYDECHSENKDVNGNIGVSGDQAVMRPLDRYTGFVDSYEANKQQISPGQEVLVAAIAGVDPNGNATYQDSVADPTFQDDFGIGPGCTSAAGTAVPPVRIKEFAEHFAVGSNQNLFSVCDTDYSVALSAIADAITEQIRPPCMPACVADTDPTTPDVLDASCVLEQTAPDLAGGGVTETNIPECNGDGTLPDSADVCYIELTGANMSMECMAEGWNLEFQIVRREGVPAPGGTSITATCELSQQKAVDCPNLPG